MPHLILEYTANVEQPIQFEMLFADLHQILVEEGGIRLDNLKSRANRLDAYYIAGGAADQAMVHLDLRLLAGRPPAWKQQIGQQVLHCLKDYYGPSLASLRLQITVEIHDIDPDAYFKIPEGTLTLVK
jgi:5-carboxymethyl-2-hydroxymuconate isomerase